MADEFDRFENEAVIRTRLSAAFSDARAAAQKGSEVDWSGLTTAVRNTLEDELAAVFVVAFILLADGGRLTNPAAIAQAAGRQWASTQATALTSGLIRNQRQELSAGIDPARVFGETRGAVIAASEVTRAITAGETAARREASGGAAGPVDTAGDATPPPATDGPLDLGDGLVAVWITELDDRVCPICKPLDRRRYEFWQERFPSGPPAHPNCRCRLRYERP